MWRINLVPAIPVNPVPSSGIWRVGESELYILTVKSRVQCRVRSVELADGFEALADASGDERERDGRLNL